MNQTNAAVKVATPQTRIPRYYWSRKRARSPSKGGRRSSHCSKTIATEENGFLFSFISFHSAPIISTIEKRCDDRGGGDRKLLRNLIMRGCVHNNDSQTSSERKNHSG